MTNNNKYKDITKNKSFQDLKKQGEESEKRFYENINNDQVTMGFFNVFANEKEYQDYLNNKNKK